MGSTKLKGASQIEVSLKESLGDKYNKERVEKYAAYCVKMKNEQDKDGNLKNVWMEKYTVEKLDGFYRRVLADGLSFDGQTIFLKESGVGYNYQAYKNKMLIAYPESKIDLQLVYEGDDYSFSKESGSVKYEHDFVDPFKQTDDRIVGGYCIIKNVRGEFLEILTKEDLKKHREVAKTDEAWKRWFKSMCLTAIIKSACKRHFQDTYEGIEEMDNNNYDLEKAGKDEIYSLGEQIIDKLEEYKGKDMEEIRKSCFDAREQGNFTVEFAESVLKKLG